MPPDDLDGLSEDFLEDLRQDAPSMPLQKIRTAQSIFQRRLSALRDVHPEAEDVSYSGPIDLKNPLDQIRFLEQAVQMCEVEIKSRGQQRPQLRTTGRDLQEQSQAEFHPSRDYRTIRFNGQEFSLTTNQAMIVKFLHERQLAGEHEVAQAAILAHLNIGSSRLRDQFRNSHGLWGKGNLVIPGSRKGMVRLNIAPKAR